MDRKRILVAGVMILINGTINAQESHPAPEDSVAGPTSAQADPLRGLDEMIRDSLTEWEIPGLAIAVVKDDEAVFLEGYGVRELGSSASVDENTVFALSSNAKTFTAMTVGILVDEGKLTWDDPVIQHLPWFRLSDPWVTENTTIRDLLAHKLAGLGAPGSWVSYLLSSEPEKLKNFYEIWNGPQLGHFRSRFEYSNFGHSLLEDVVEAASGITWESFLDTRILTPLGMSSTTADPEKLWNVKDLAPCFSSNPPNLTVHNEDARVKNIVMPHWPDADDRFFPGRWRNCSGLGGGLSSSVADIANWLRLWLGAGSYDGEQIVSSDIIEEMQSGQMIMPTPSFAELLGPGFGHFWSMGFGWALVDYHGKKLLYFSGGGPGASSFMALMPEENLGVAVVMNRPGNLVDWILTFGIFDAYLGNSDQDWIRGKFSRAEANGKRTRAIREANERELQAGRARDTNPSVSLENYVGEYRHPAVGNVAITRDDGGLVLRFPDAEPGYMEHWNYDVFRVTWNMPLPWRKFLTFELDPAGRVSKFTVETLTFERQ